MFIDFLPLFLFSLPVSVLAFIFEIYPRLKNRLVGVDIWTHLLYLKEYHKQKGIPKKIEDGFIIQGRYDYPPAFITILSKFPYKMVEKYEFLFSPVFDTIHIISIFFFAYLLTGSLLISFLTQILYALTPIIILENSSATPRSLGYTLFTFVFITIFFAQQNMNFYFYGIAVLLGSFIFLSHRFTTQGFLIFSIIFSIIESDITYIIVFVGSFILSLILSKGFYLTVLQGHIGNLRFWRKNIRYRFAHQIKGLHKQHKTNDFVFSVYNQFLRFPPFVFSITNPWTVPVFYMFMFEFPNNPLLQKMVWWVLISYILALLTTWVPKLRFLGEGQRYLELSAFPAALLSSYILIKTSNDILQGVMFYFYFFVGLLSFITIIVIQRKAIINDQLRSLTPSMRKMFRFLKQEKIKPRLLCIPHQITTNTIYHTGCPVFVNADYTNIEKISDVYPFLKKPIKQIMEEHKLDAILLNEQYAKREELRLKRYTIIKEFDNYVLIKLSNNSL